MLRHRRAHQLSHVHVRPRFQMKVRKSLSDPILCPQRKVERFQYIELQRSPKKNRLL